MPNLSITPVRAYYDTRMSQEDIILLGIVCQHTDENGYCYPSLDTLSSVYSPIVGRDEAYDDSSMSIRIKKLVDRGYMSRNQRHTQNGGFKSNGYRVLYDEVLPLEFDRRKIKAGAPLEKSPEKIQASLEKPLVKIQASLENSRSKIQTNDPIERPKLNDPKLVPPPQNLPSDSKNNPAPSKPNIFTLYENAIGLITPHMAEILKDAEKDYAAEWVTRAFNEAVIHNKRNWAYVRAILKRWEADGFDGDAPGKPPGKSKPQKQSASDSLQEGIRKLEEILNGNASENSIDHDQVIEGVSIPITQ